jgi:hypothetical protein
VEIYLPNKNKSELDVILANRKTNLEKSNEFDRSNKKGKHRMRDRPIVHEHDENQPQFYIPNF